MIKHYALPQDVRNELMRYLSQRPWEEVHLVMPILRDLVEVPTVPGPVKPA